MSNDGRTPTDLPRTIDAHGTGNLRFGHFELRPARHELLAHGQAVTLGSRAFELLLVLVQQRDRVVGKHELLERVWPGLVVEEHNIATQISTLRKVLGADVIATVPARGYRFTALVDEAPGGAARAIGEAPARHNLPGQRTRFIGRDAALAGLQRLLPSTRLLTLSGIGGCGKTRLALQFAQAQLDNFADGVWFVDLAPLLDARRVAAACAAVLGLHDAAETSLEHRLVQHLRPRRALLVLDNCEHVIAGAAALAEAVLAGAPDITIVATSREPLDIAGEQIYPVRSLSLPATEALDAVLAAESVQVFADRARRLWPEFAIDASNAAAVAEICRRLDGIALAIELAAARVAMLSPRQIAARLDQRFQLLTGGSRSLPRHQTLHAAMRWSYELLPPPEQQMLRAVSVFAGGFTLQAAAAVASVADEYDALAHLSALHDKSLLEVERGAGRPAQEDAGPARYRMLETVRQYAQRQLDDCGEAPAVRTRHAEHFLALAESAAPHLHGAEQPQWMASLREEQENLVAAMNWCTGAAGASAMHWGLRLAAATSRYWLFNDIGLGCQLAAAALQHDSPAGEGGEAADNTARFHTLHGLAGMSMHRGDAQASLLHGRRALDLARRQGVLEWQTKALTALGSALNTERDAGAALQHYHEALQLARKCGSTEYMATLSNNIAEIERARGELASAEQHYDQALGLARAHGNLLLAAIVLHNLVRLLLAAGRSDDARVRAVEAELLLRGLGERVLKWELLKVSAGLASTVGEHALAARWWGASQPRFIDAGYSDPQIDVLQMAQQMGQAREALSDVAFDRCESAGRELELEAAMLELRQWLTRPPA